LEQNANFRKHVFLARPVLLWPFLALPIFLLVHFGAELFGMNLTKIIFSFLFSFSNFSIFLIYKNTFSVFFIFFFQRQSMIFCLFLINFFPLYIKKYKFKHTATVFSGVVIAQSKVISRVTALSFMQFSLEIL